MSAGVLWIKACARGGCTAIVRAKGPKTLERVRFCSTRCGALESMRNGWRPPRSSTEELRARGRRGGKARGVTMHKRRIAAVVVQAERLIPPDVLDALDRLQLAALRKAIVEISTAQYHRGYMSALTAKGRAAQKTRDRLNAQAA